MSKPLRKCTSCSLEAWNKEDLELFKKSRESKYGVMNLCKKCHNAYETKRRVPAPRPPYLRKCMDCGLEAWTEKDLKLFRKGKLGLFGRRNICLVCFNKRVREIYKKNKLWHFHFRTKNELLKLWDRPLICTYCHEEIIKLEGNFRDTLAIHSLDGNHNNWNPKNKTPMHNKCHVAFHNKGRKISEETREKYRKAKGGKNAYNWQGDAASDKAKYCRAWRLRNPNYNRKRTKREQLIK